MKRFLASLVAAASLLATSNSFAIFGGPFDNGFHYNLSGGTYTTVYSMPNGSGFMRFSADPSFTNAGTGGLNSVDSQGTNSSVFYRGIIYTGTSGYGMVDPDSGTAMGMSVGMTEGNDQSGGAGSAFNNVRNGVNEIETGNIGTCAVNWNAEIKENGYNLRFKGDGVAHFYGALDTVETTNVNEFDAQDDRSFEGGLTNEVGGVSTGAITITPASTTITPGDLPTDTIETTTITTSSTSPNPSTTPDPLTAADFVANADDTELTVSTTVVDVEIAPVTTITQNSNGVSITKTGRTVTTHTTTVYDASTVDLVTDPDNVDVSLSTVLSSSSTSTTTETMGTSTPGTPDIVTFTPGTRTEAATVLTPTRVSENNNNQDVTIDNETTFTSSGGQNTDFHDVGHQVRVKVYGSRTSWNLNTFGGAQ